MLKPLVSVLLPTRDRVRLLARALRSLQRQSWEALEILVLDDASRDNTPELLKQIAYQDPRVRWIRRETSQGLADGLNALIAMSGAEWLARMDDDDICYPERIARQLAWMQRHQLDVCGTWYRRRSLLGQSVVRPPVEDERIRAELMFQPPLLHPSVMLRRDVIERHCGYALDMPHAEDYELWARLAPHVRFGNVPEVLMDYTLSARQLSRQYNAIQVASAQQIRGAYLDSLAIKYTAAQRDIHIHLRDPVPIEHLDMLDAIEDWLVMLRGQCPESVSSVIERQWYLSAVRAAGLGLAVYRKFITSLLAPEKKGPKHAILLALCMTRLRYRSQPYRWLEPLAAVD